MKIKRGDKAVSEIVGSILLLAIAISIFSVVYMNVLSEDGPNPETYATIVGKMEPEGNIFNTVAFENRRGETLGPDTEIILTIYGEQKPPKKISDFTYLNGDWNIGEKIYPVFNLGDLSGTQIDATIVDKKSNSMVFWGRLQEGAVAPPPGRGGIWHFNEEAKVWTDEQPDGVLDSSENGNHGTAKGGATTITDAMSIRSGYFDGLNDYVKVIPKVPYSLNIQDSITVEAWMKPLTGIDIDTSTFDPSMGYYPNITHISGDIYAVVYRVGPNPNQDGIIKTFKIASDGQIDDSSPLDDWTFASACFDPKIIKISNDLCAIAYGSQNSMVIQTVSISSEGIITPIKQKPFVTEQTQELEIIHITGDIYAVVYSDVKPSKSSGKITTVHITDSGDIIPMVSNQPFDLDSCEDPDIIYISENIYAITYIKNNDCVIKILKINELTGIIEDDLPNNYQKISSTKTCDDPTVTRVVGSTYIAVAYSNNNAKEGILQTIDINLDKGIQGIISIKKFEIESCNDPDIIFASDNQYIVVYEGPTAHIGKLKIFTINSENGLIDPKILKDYTYNEYRGCEPNIIPTYGSNDRVFIIVYRNKKPHDGNLGTYRLIDDPTLPWYRGIFKFGSINIYCSETNVYASLTTEDNSEYHLSLNEGTITPNNWYHVVLTFDGSKISLYCNKAGESFIKEEGKTYSHIDLSSQKTIKIPDESRLYFGYLFYGYIDEVAIHNKVLTDNDPTSLSSVQYHFGNPGYFENEI